MPPKHTSLGMAAKIMTSIEAQPLPARLTPPVELMLRKVSGQMGFVVRMALANLWLFRPVLLNLLSKNPVQNALIRTTFAVTMAEASDACNVLPQTTRFNVNVRILSGETVDTVQQHFENLIKEAGADGTVEIILRENPSPVSPADSEFFKGLENIIKEVYPTALATPYLVMGGTDSRQFAAISNNVLRFTPVSISEEGRKSVHSTNENISVENYGRMIAFFEMFIRQLD